MKVRVEKHDKTVEIIEVETFTEEDANRISEMINSNDVLVVPIGPQVFSRILIAHVKPVEEEIVAPQTL